MHYYISHKMHPINCLISLIVNNYALLGLALFDSGYGGELIFFLNFTPFFNFLQCHIQSLATTFCRP